MYDDYEQPRLWKETTSVIALLRFCSRNLVDFFRVSLLINSLFAKLSFSLSRSLFRPRSSVTAFVRCVSRGQLRFHLWRSKWSSRFLLLKGKCLFLESL